MARVNATDAAMGLTVKTVLVVAELVFVIIAEAVVEVVAVTSWITSLADL
jgi:hypothetical protein